MRGEVWFGVGEGGLVGFAGGWIWRWMEGVRMSFEEKW